MRLLMTKLDYYRLAFRQPKRANVFIVRRTVLQTMAFDDLRLGFQSACHGRGSVSAGDGRDCGWSGLGMVCGGFLNIFQSRIGGTGWDGKPTARRNIRSATASPKITDIGDRGSTRVIRDLINLRLRKNDGERSCLGRLDLNRRCVQAAAFSGRLP